MLVPDTFGLQERAGLALHAITEATDPLADYEPYPVVFFRNNPPLMIHNSWQGFLLLYQRQHYRDNSTRWRKTQRFVSGENIHW